MVKKISKKEKENTHLLITEQNDEDFFNNNKEVLKELGENEKRLQQNKELFENDPSYILYRLPITEAQREKIYNAIINQNKNKN